MNDTRQSTSEARFVVSPSNSMRGKFCVHERMPNGDARCPLANAAKDACDTYVREHS